MNVLPPQEWPRPYPYANYMVPTMTPHEFTLHFGHYTIPALTQPPEGGTLSVEVEPVVSVSVPLNLARGVARALEQAVRNWETAFGQSVPEPPGEQPTRPA